MDLELEKALQKCVITNCVLLQEARSNLITYQLRNGAEKCVFNTKSFAHPSLLRKN